MGIPIPYLLISKHIMQSINFPNANNSIGIMTELVTPSLHASAAVATNLRIEEGDSN